MSAPLTLLFLLGRGLLDGLSDRAALARLAWQAWALGRDESVGYQMVRELGRGGMGVVHLAVRDTDGSGPVEEGHGEILTAGPLLNDGALHRITLVRDMDAQVLALYADGLEVAERPLNAGGPIARPIA